MVVKVEDVMVMEIWGVVVVKREEVQVIEV